MAVKINKPKELKFKMPHINKTDHRGWFITEAKGKNKSLHYLYTDGVVRYKADLELEDDSVSAFFHSKTQAEDTLAEYFVRQGVRDNRINIGRHEEG